MKNDLLTSRKNTYPFNTTKGLPVGWLSDEAINLGRVEKMTFLVFVDHMRSALIDLEQVANIHFSYYFKKLQLPDPEYQYSEIHFIKKNGKYEFKYKHNENDVLNDYILKHTSLNNYASATVLFENKDSESGLFTMEEMAKILANFFEQYRNV